MLEKDYWAMFATEAIRRGYHKETCAQIATYLVEKMNRDLRLISIFEPKSTKGESPPPKEQR
jgi:hypothetical protein